MAIINDQDLIKYRSGLQVLRDNTAIDLAIFMQDFKQRVELRRQEQKPMISQSDEAYITKKILEILKIQYELKTGDELLFPTRESGIESLGKLKQDIIEAALNANDVVYDISLLAVPMCEDELRKKGFIS